MRVTLFVGVSACLAVGACMQVTTGNETGSGAQAPGSSTAVPGDAAAAAAGCFADPSGQVVLCEEVGLCPGVLVDPAAFSGCGFRQDAPSPLDLECVCGEALCPIGAPTSCAEAQQLLAGQNALAVCLQRDEGRCLPLSTPDAGASSTCDRQ